MTEQTPETPPMLLPDGVLPSPPVPLSQDELAQQRANATPTAAPPGG